MSLSKLYFANKARKLAAGAKMHSCCPCHEEDLDLREAPR